MQSTIITSNEIIYSN